MKKFIVAAVLVFAFALTLNVAFASYRRGDDGCCRDRRSNDCCPSVDVDNDNDVDVDNNVTTKANTGENYSGSYSRRSRSFGSIETGDAISTSEVSTSAYAARVEVDSPRQGSVDVDNDNDVDVDNNVYTSANSGRNRVSSGRIETGVADALGSVTTVVNGAVVIVD